MPSAENESIRFVTGSTSDLPVAWAREHNIGIVPAVIRFGEEVFVDNADFTMAAFLEKLRTSKDFPKTAAPNLEVYKPFYEYQGPIISIHAGSALSSFWANSEATRRELNIDNIFPYDSESVSLGEGFLVMKAVELEAQGASRKGTGNHPGSG